MTKFTYIKGFSKLSLHEKQRLVAEYTGFGESFLKDIRDLRHPDKEIQGKLDSFSENTLSNFPMPFGVAPNFLINGKYYMVPMVIEESSVVAAASSAAGFWFDKGGFRATVHNVLKTGQISFIWKENKNKLFKEFPLVRDRIISGTGFLTARMQERGGGLKKIELVDLSEKSEGLFQLLFSFQTADSMGANFINTVLEHSAEIVRQHFNGERKDSPVEIIMSILSNYTPECTVSVEVRTAIENLDRISPDLSGKEFAQKFVMAVTIAREDVYRAVTHNKGIFNGLDAVVMATGNDFRAVEAGGHAYAARNGKYASLSRADYSDGEFVHELELPLAIGTVGGLTRIHPLAKWSFEILGQPDAQELMTIAAAAGLANNFAAIRSLITTGIQKGHMKMHLENILNFLGADEEEKQQLRKEFENKTISQTAVKEFLDKIRGVI